MPGQWEESKHPRAQDGKFGEGSGGVGGGAKPTATAKKKPGSAKAAAKGAAGVKTKAASTKVAAAQAKAKAKAADIVAKAKEKAKALKGGAKTKADAAKAKADASGKKLTGAQKTRHAAAKRKAKEKADAIVAKAKERAAAVKAKAGAKPTAKRTKPKAPTTQPKPAQPVPAQAPKSQDSKPVSSLPKEDPLSRYIGMPKSDPLQRDMPKPAAAPAPAAPAPASTAKPLGDDGIADLRKRFTASATPEEFEAVGYYQGMFSQTINKALRKGGEPEKDKQMVEWATKNLDSVLEKNKSTNPMITYRGSGAHESFANLKEGETFVDNGFMSTSADKSMTMGGDFQFHITSPAGTKMGAITTDETGHEGAWGLEQEVLLGRGTALRLDRREAAIHEEGYPITIMHMTVVGQR